MAEDDRALRVRLFNILYRRFSLSELRTLCFLLGVDYEDLAGENKADKARELIAHLERRGQLEALIETGRDLRGDVRWPDIAPRESYEPEMILIPAGEFLMGSDPAKDKGAYNDEQPEHTLTLPDYSLARTPVTNAQYLAYVQATGQNAPGHWEGGVPPGDKGDHPVVNVSWRDAMAYCRWLAQATGKAYSLPSEAEWEKGARGTDGRIYPWGDQWDAARCNSAESGKGEPTPVGAYPRGASPYGLLDMAGNVWEWTRSLEKRYLYDPDDGREDLEALGARVLRGGTFNYYARSARCACRLWDRPVRWDRNYGFRVCVVAQ